MLTTPPGSTMREVFSGCQNLRYLNLFDSTASNTTLDMFLNCDSLVEPDATAQTDLTDSDGASWTSSQAYTQLTFEMNVTTDSGNAPDLDVVGGNVTFTDIGNNTWNITSYDVLESVKFANTNTNDATEIILINAETITDMSSMCKYISDTIKFFYVAWCCDVSNVTTIDSMFYGYSTNNKIHGIQMCFGCTYYDKFGNKRSKWTSLETLDRAFAGATFEDAFDFDEILAIMHLENALSMNYMLSDIEGDPGIILDLHLEIYAPKLTSMSNMFKMPFLILVLTPLP
jgi:hypothetical protein